MRPWSAGALGLCAVGFACSRDPGAEDPGTRGVIARSGEWIIGGTDSGDEAVVWLRLPDGSGCSGFLVSPRVVASAAHCLANSVRNGLEGGEVGFGADGRAEPRAIDAMYVHRAFTGVVPPGNFDIGLVRMVEPAPALVEPMVINGQALGSSIVGMTVRAVGFGESNAYDHTGGGIRRTVDMMVVDWGEGHLYMGTSRYNTCRGDSGGPVLGVLDEAVGEVVLGLNSYGPIACNGPAAKTRVDIYADLLAEVISAWDGPCASDGVCPADPGACAFPDPDCDDCGLNGICTDDCPRPDLDCPLGGSPGDACSAAEDCEHRLCDTDDGVCVAACGVDRAGVHRCPRGFDCGVLADGTRACRASGSCSIAAQGPSGAHPGAGRWFLFLVFVSSWLIRTRTRTARSGTVLH